MNIVYSLMLIVSIAIMIVVSPDKTLSLMLKGTSNALTLSLTLISIYSIWLSIFKIMEKIGLNNLIYKAFKPITKRAFKGENDKALEYITLNLSANLIGIGGAATPMGIKAMEQMQDGSIYATDNMILFMVINTTSIQILPATIIGLRTAAGSSNASDIIIPSLIATTISTISGILLCLIFRKFKRRKTNG